MTNDDLIQMLLNHESSGPRVSLYMPTVRAGTEVRQNAIRFKNRLREAREDLEARGHDAGVVDSLLAPAQPRLEDEDFWSHQREGFALFSGARPEPGGAVARRPRRLHRRGRTLPSPTAADTPCRGATLPCARAEPEPRLPVRRRLGFHAADVSRQSPTKHRGCTRQ